jgi:hypothetical protein
MWLTSKRSRHRSVDGDWILSLRRSPAASTPLIDSKGTNRPHGQSPLPIAAAPVMLTRIRGIGDAESEYSE